MEAGIASMKKRAEEAEVMRSLRAYPWPNRAVEIKAKVALRKQRYRRG
jgi:hypothetical protein